MRILGLHDYSSLLAPLLVTTEGHLLPILAPMHLLRDKNSVPGLLLGELCPFKLAHSGVISAVGGILTVADFSDGEIHWSRPAFRVLAPMVVDGMLILKLAAAILALRGAWRFLLETRCKSCILHFMFEKYGYCSN